MMNLREFEPLVKGVSKRATNLMTQEDTEQDLWVKLLEVMPRLRALPEEEVRAFAHTTLSNEVKDLIRGEKVRVEGRSVGELNLDEVAREGLDLLSDVVSIDLTSQYDFVAYRELTEALTSWAERQTDFVAELVSELLNPTDRVHVAWKDMAKRHPAAYANCAAVPRQAYATAFGVPRERVERALKKIRQFLIQSGYARAYA